LTKNTLLQSRFSGNKAASSCHALARAWAYYLCCSAKTQKTRHKFYECVV